MNSGSVFGGNPGGASHRSAGIQQSQVKLNYKEVSAASGENIESLFNQIVSDIMNNIVCGKIRPDKQGSQGVRINTKNSVDNLSKLKSNFEDSSDNHQQGHTLTGGRINQAENSEKSDCC